ncbi:MAG: helix-turn-helix domain-containing protein [Bacteroidia bacterium]|nr:helix-turn-helix domain-containing protein [Bacteroidia bacterium]
MAVELITKDDLNAFKTEVINEIRQILKPKGSTLAQKEWLKSYEVRKLLGISPGKLQNMRVNGTIAFTQIGGLMFYKYDDIVKLMEENKTKNPFIARNGK